MITQVDGTSYIYRNGWGDFPDNAGDWTIQAQFRYASTPSGGAVVFSLFEGAADFGGNYLSVASTLSTSNVYLEVVAGTISVATTVHAITVGTNSWVAVNYDASATELTFFANGTTVATTVVDLSLVTWNHITCLSADIPALSPDVQIGYLRAWSSELTLSTLNAETASITVVYTTNSLWNNPLQVSFDLTDHNGGLNQFLASGTVSTTTNDPLLTVVASPQSNTTPATALAFATTTAILQSITTVAGSRNTWRVFTPSTGVEVISVMALHLTSTVQTCNVSVAAGLANANANNFFISSNANRGVQFGVVEGIPYYTRIVTGTNGTIAASLLQGLDLDVAEGSYAINDDTPPEADTYLPLVFMDHDTGFPINFINDFPQGEGGEILESGRLLVSNEHNNGFVYLYDHNYAQIGSLNLGFASGIDERVCIASNRVDEFLVAHTLTANTTRLTIVDNDCVELLHWDVSTPGVFLTALGVLPDMSLAYLCIDDGANQPILTVDLSTGAFTTSLNAGLAGYGCGRDILCYGTNSILVPYYDSAGTQSCIVRKYDTTGAVLATFNYDAYVSSNSDVLDFRLCSWIDDDSFVAWLKGPLTGQDIILKCATSNGAVEDQTQVLDEYESYKFFANATNTPQRFGHSECCPIWVVRSGAVPPPVNPGSGIYFLDFDTRHDVLWVDASVGTTTAVKIP